MPYIIATCVIVAIIIFIFIMRRSLRKQNVEKKGRQGEKAVARILGNTEEGVQYVINDCTLRVGEGKPLKSTIF